MGNSDQPQLRTNNEPVELRSITTDSQSHSQGRNLTADSDNNRIPCTLHFWPWIEFYLAS